MAMKDINRINCKETKRTRSTTRIQPKVASGATIVGTGRGPTMKTKMISESRNALANSNTSNPRSIEHDEDHISLEVEKTRHERKFNLRKRTFEGIISNSPFSFEWSKFGLYLMGTFIVCYLSTVPWSIFPLHNFVFDQGHWYELAVQNTILCSINNLGFALYSTTMLGKYLSIDYIQTRRNILIVFLVSYLLTCLFYPTAYLIWTRVLQYRYPVPFIGYMSGSIIGISQTITIWLLLPLSWRENDGFRKKCMYLLIGTVGLCVAVLLQYFTIATLLLKFKNKYQPILVIPLYVMKKKNLEMFFRLLDKTSSGDFQGAKIMASFAFAVYHAMFICISMGSMTTYPTAWCIVVLKILMSIYICLKIVWIKRSNTLDVEKQITLLQTLCINELVEFIVPIVFLGSLATAYYGPNSGMMGNIGSDVWHYTSIKDISVNVRKILMFFFTDLSSLGISSITLFMAFKINLFKFIVALEREFSKSFCIVIGFWMMSVSTKFIFGIPLIFIRSDHQFSKCL